MCNSNSEHHKNTIDEIQEDQQQSSVPENEPIEDEIEILEVVKGSMNEEILLDMKKSSILIDKFVNNENDKHDAIEVEETMSEIDNPEKRLLISRIHYNDNKTELF